MTLYVILCGTGGETEILSLLKNVSTQIEVEQSARAFRTKHPGSGAVAIRNDGRVCAVGGWDGR